MGIEQGRAKWFVSHGHWNRMELRGSFPVMQCILDRHMPTRMLFSYVSYVFNK